MMTTEELLQLAQLLMRWITTHDLTRAHVKRLLRTLAEVTTEVVQRMPKDKFGEIPF